MDPFRTGTVSFGMAIRAHSGNHPPLFTSPQDPCALLIGDEGDHLLRPGKGELPAEGTIVPVAQQDPLGPPILPSQRGGEDRIPDNRHISPQ